MVGNYYPGTIHALTVALLDVWNDIEVVKYDKNGVEVERKSVPVMSHIAEKFHMDRLENNYVDADNVQHGDRYYQSVPRISVKMNGMMPSPDRAVASHQWRFFKAGTEDPIDILTHNVISSFQPTPWDVSFTISIRSDSMQYLAQILEGHVLPFFNPSLTIRVKEIPGYNIERDIVIMTDGLAFDIPDTMMDNESRRCDATFNVVARAWFYRQPMTAGKIRTIHTSYQTTSDVEKIKISGYAVGTSAIPASAFSLSGQYTDTTKKFDWYEQRIIGLKK